MGAVGQPDYSIRRGLPFEHLQKRRAGLTLVASTGLGFGVLVWFVGMGWRWKVRDSWAGDAGGQPAMTPRGSAVADEVSGEFSSTSLRSTIRRDGSAYSLPPLGGWGSPKGTAVESAGGTKAPSQPCIEGLVYSRAMRIALTRTRRMNGASSRLVSQAYMLLRVDGPSIDWMGGGRVSRGLWIRRWRLSLEPWSGAGRSAGWAWTLSPREGWGWASPWVVVPPWV